jgi:hypothetical protein
MKRARDGKKSTQNWRPKAGGSWGKRNRDGRSFCFLDCFLDEVHVRRRIVEDVLDELAANLLGILPNPATRNKKKKTKFSSFRPPIREKKL